jgi:hypothetical protein
MSNLPISENILKQVQQLEINSKLLDVIRAGLKNSDGTLNTAGEYLLETLMKTNNNYAEVLDSLAIERSALRFITVQVWQAIKPDYKELKTAPKDLNLTHTNVSQFTFDVLTELQACRKAYSASQNTEDSDIPWGGRSTSIGDILMIFSMQCNVGTALYTVGEKDFYKL